MHKTLARQLSRALGLEAEAQLTAFVSAARELAVDDAATAAALSGLGNLLQRVAATYEQYDRDLDLRTRSLDLVSEELLEANRKLQQQVAHAEKTNAEYVSALRFSEALLNAMPIAVFFKDREGRYLGCNPAFTEIMGVTADQIRGKTVQELWPGELAAVYHDKDLELMADPAPQQYEFEIRDRRQRPRQVVYVKDVFRNDRNEVAGIIGAFVDITERKQAEKALQLAASVFSSAQEGIAVSDAENRIVDVNDAFVRISGYARDQLVGRDPSLLGTGEEGPKFYAAMWRTIAAEGRWQGEVANRRPDGEAYVARLTVSLVRDENGMVTHHIGVLSDITAEKRQQEALERVAHYDALTGLPNRVLLADRMRQALAQTKRNRDRLAVCYLDLDNFKPINDTFGHDAGDRLLAEIAERLRLCMRGGDTIARLGGDEFVLLFLGLGSRGECEAAIERIVEVVAQPMALAGQSVAVSASLGVSLYPDDDSDADTLLRHADQAMYQAKQAGRNCFRVFDFEGSRRARRQQETLERVREAIAAGEFVLHYQPKVDMRQNRVKGVEALVRWQHPEHGLMLPGEFLPAIEETDVIVALGDWVIGEALRQSAIWYDWSLHLPVSVNISARHLQQPDFVARLGAHLAAQPQLPAGTLRLEIVESAALEDMAYVSRIIDSCHELAVGIELDDFGTGYSSLTYLRRLPADALKIDQSFVRDMLEDGEDLAIVEGVIGLAAAFKMDVIAEGVETIEHGVLLMSLGCDLAQGYGIARPMPAAAVPDWVAAHRPHAAWQLWAGKRWEREHLPLMLAQYDHIKWVQRVVDGAIKPGIAPAGAELTDRHSCRFGQWYDREGKASFGDLDEYRNIDPIHRRVHEIGTEIVALRRAGDATAAQERCQELMVLKTDILDKLAALQHAAARTAASP